MEIKHIEIIPYNTNYPIVFASESTQIKAALGANCVAVHHIGSTSVPGLSAKPKIDIIAVVKNAKKSITSLESIGYAYRGEWNIPFKYGFTKRGEVSINLHVYEENHPEIELNIKFRDYLINNKQAKAEYERLKESLLLNEESFIKKKRFFTGYNLGKDKFIRKTLNKLNLESLRFLKVTHLKEWEEYHRIRKEQLFDPINIIYDQNHPSILSENSSHFILCKGTEITSVAMIEFLNDTTAALRSLATDNKYQNQGYGKYILKQIEKWLKEKNIFIIKTHANKKAENFYRNLGYFDYEFNDKSISIDTIDLAKKLQ